MSKSLQTVDPRSSIIMPARAPADLDCPKAPGLLAQRFTASGDAIFSACGFNRD
jgi:hypothetical protein